jgi:hypothetical protein
MLQYPVWQLGASLVMLERLERSFQELIRGDPDRRDVAVPADFLGKHLTPDLSYCRSHCEDLELNAAVARVDLITTRINGHIGISFEQVRSEVRVLRETIESELKYRRFVFVPTEKAQRLDKVDHDWAEVQTKFPSAQDDIRAAVECYAVDCNTACVFHSMRVAERGLRVLAKVLKVTTVGQQKHPLEFSEWGLILNAIAGKLKAIQQSPGRNAAKAALAKFYADAASQADYPNEIWRKEVSHARGMYNAPEALNALMRTHDFMSLLSQRLSEKDGRKA